MPETKYYFLRYTFQTIEHQVLVENEHPLIYLSKSAAPYNFLTRIRNIWFTEIPREVFEELHIEESL